MLWAASRSAEPEIGIVTRRLQCLLVQLIEVMKTRTNTLKKAFCFT